MKHKLLVLLGRVDALALRERVVLFFAILGSLTLFLYSTFISPQFANQNQLLTKLAQQQNNSVGIDTAITKKIEASRNDPNIVLKDQLIEVKAEVATLINSLQSKQKDLVAPEKISQVLEIILKNNGRLQLLSLRSLAASDIRNNSSAPLKTALKEGVEFNIQKKIIPDAAPVERVSSKDSPLFFKHGVEIVLQGSYLDMVNYMAALEAMPSQVFWANATLDANAYPAVRLSLTLYTVSLDQRWIKF